MRSALTGLLRESRQLGFLGPGPIDGQVRHALAFAAAVPHPPERALDLGAGGGLPGLVLAAERWPETRWCLLDAQAKRAAFLDLAVDELGLGDRVRVVRARAEEQGRVDGERGAFDLVVSRSFAAPGITAECAAPLLCTGGLLVASEPPDAMVSERWPATGLAELGFAPAEAVVVDGTEPIHLVRVALRVLTPERYPRRVGVPAKRPLF